MSTDIFDCCEDNSARLLLNDEAIKNKLYQGSLLNRSDSRLLDNCWEAVQYAEILLILMNNRILRGNDCDCWVDEERLFNDAKTMDLDLLAEEMLSKIKRSTEEEFVDEIPDFSEHYFILKKYLLEVCVLLRNASREGSQLDCELKNILDKLKIEFSYFYSLACTIYDSPEIIEYEEIVAEEYRENLNSYI